MRSLLAATLCFSTYQSPGIPLQDCTQKRFRGLQIQKPEGKCHWRVLPSALTYKTDKSIMSKPTTQTVIAAENAEKTWGELELVT